MLIFNVRNQSISRIDTFLPAEKSENYLEATFDFKTDDWEGATKTAVFRNIKSNVTKDIILSDNRCIVPWEVLTEKGQIEVSVHGLSLDDKITTNIAEFTLNATLYGGSATAEPTPDIYQQIIDMLENIEINGVTDEQIAKAVERYLTENPVESIPEEEVQKIVVDYIEAHKDELKGEDGYTPQKGVDYFDGEDGKDGKDGEDGYTPVKGTDYFTDADKEEMVQAVLNALPIAEGVAF